MQKMLTILCFICAASLTSIPAKADVEACLDRICLDDYRPRLAEIKRLYGSGSIERSFHRNTVCFQDGSRSVRFTFMDEPDYRGALVDVFLTREKLCKTHVSSRRKLPFQTGKKVKLGDPEEKVIAAYGAPSHIVDAVKRVIDQPLNHTEDDYSLRHGEKVLYYAVEGTELLTAMFYIKRGTVNAIMLSQSE
jgi:hypothetical protein